MIEGRGRFRNESTCKKLGLEFAIRRPDIEWISAIRIANSRGGCKIEINQRETEDRFPHLVRIFNIF